MVFAHDTELSLQYAAALINTAPGHGDSTQEDLPTVQSLVDHLDAWEWSGGRPRTRAELDEVHALRPRLQELWSRDVEGLVAGVNELLAEHHALPRLVRHDDLDWHIHATDDDDPIARRMAVEAAMAFIDLIRAGETERLRVCAADDCDDVVIDLSRNRSRRYCDGTCANKAHVAAYRDRQGRRARSS
ncbi:putative stress-induced transcription regulator [Knoellia remsis]|uniref:Putative stress-induced transcription regulator n=1 Tax=Knoellia remsis TaxID=407159 RepID=A0A2T0UJJ7_9MICO|nr:CGNR zinc finger domain-containing protein [Knoellia remsis]PRY58111.1 putative stress-induced transcription regulator [Knoellia remsis]